MQPARPFHLPPQARSKLAHKQGTGKGAEAEEDKQEEALAAELHEDDLGGDDEVGMICVFMMVFLLFLLQSVLAGVLGTFCWGHVGGMGRVGEQGAAAWLA